MLVYLVGFITFLNVRVRYSCRLNWCVYASSGLSSEIIVRVRYSCRLNWCLDGDLFFFGSIEDVRVRYSCRLNWCQVPRVPHNALTELVRVRYSCRLNWCFSMQYLTCFGVRSTSESPVFVPAQLMLYVFLLCLNENLQVRVRYSCRLNWCVVRIALENNEPSGESPVFVPAQLMLSFNIALFAACLYVRVRYSCRLNWCLINCVRWTEAWKKWESGIRAGSIDALKLWLCQGKVSKVRVRYSCRLNWCHLSPGTFQVRYQGMWESGIRAGSIDAHR